MNQLLSESKSASVLGEDEIFKTNANPEHNVLQERENAVNSDARFKCRGTGWYQRIHNVDFVYAEQIQLNVLMRKNGVSEGMHVLCRSQCSP